MGVETLNDFDVGVGVVVGVMPSYFDVGVHTPLQTMGYCGIGASPRKAPGWKITPSK